MTINADILHLLKSNDNMITATQFTNLGYSRTLLSKYVKAGLLERVRHGTYILANSSHDDMYTLMLRSKYIVFSHDTALFLNGLSDRTPFSHSVTIPSNAALPVSIKGECTCYYVKSELYELGLIEKKTTFGNVVKCYNPERTICDLIRSRSRCDEETVISAIKNYANSNNKDLNQLASYAEKFRISSKLRQYMEVLLWVLNQWA